MIIYNIYISLYQMILFTFSMRVNHKEIDFYV